MLKFKENSGVHIISYVDSLALFFGYFYLFFLSAVCIYLFVTNISDYNYRIVVVVFFILLASPIYFFIRKKYFIIDNEKKLLKYGIFYKINFSDVKCVNLIHSSAYFKHLRIVIENKNGHKKDIFCTPFITGNYAFFDVPLKPFYDITDIQVKVFNYLKNNTNLPTVEIN